MADPNYEAAVTMLAKGLPDAQAQDAATTGDAPAERAQDAAPATDGAAAPAKETAAPDQAKATPSEEEALLADLEARRKAREARQPAQQGPDVAQLSAKIQELEQRLAQQPRHESADFRTLVAQHGPIEALRRSGYDPLEWHERLKAEAKNPSAANVERLREQAKAEAKAEAEAAARAVLENDARQRQQSYAEQSKRAMEAAFLQVTELPDAGLKYLHKLTPADRLRETYQTIADRNAAGYDVAHLTDHQLAKLVDMTIAERIARLTDALTPASAPKQPTNVAVNDGPKTTQAQPASLTNDLASQSTGRSRATTEKERLREATRIMMSGSQE